MERLTKRLSSGAPTYNYPASCYFDDDSGPDKIAQSAFRQRCVERLAAYEETGLTPERCAEFARADAEGRYIVMRDAEQEGVARLRELAEADKDGRLFILPLEPGRSMLYQQDFERPCVMKNVAPCIQYQSSAGIIFFMRYYTFSRLVENGRITPLLPEGEKTLEAMKDE